MKTILKLIPNNFSNSKQLFEEEKSKLSNLLSKFNLRVEHMGSTAVPNTIGKGIIDMLLICEDKKTQLQIKDILVQNDYRQGELKKKPDGRLFFYHSQNQHFKAGLIPGDIHIHLILKGDKTNLVILKVRDYLLSHPDQVEAYNKEKIELSKSTNKDRREYRIRKSNFIEELITKLD